MPARFRSPFVTTRQIAAAPGVTGCFSVDGAARISFKASSSERVAGDVLGDARSLGGSGVVAGHRYVRCRNQSDSRERLSADTNISPQSLCVLRVSVVNGPPQRASHDERDRLTTEGFSVRPTPSSPSPSAPSHSSVSARRVARAAPPRTRHRVCRGRAATRRGARGRG